jgi:hypothetical protein
VQPARAESQSLEGGGVAAPAPGEEARRRGPDGDEANVDVEAVARADHVAEQATVAVDRVGRRLAREPDERPRRQQPLPQRRGLPAVALGAEVDLGRVDLNEPDPRPGREVERVAVSNVVDAAKLAYC